MMDSMHTPEITIATCQSCGQKMHGVDYIDRINAQRDALSSDLSRVRKERDRLHSALFNFSEAFQNRGEETSLHIWNERMKEAHKGAKPLLEPAAIKKARRKVMTDLETLQRITDYIRLMREDLEADLDQWDEEDRALALVVPAEEEVSRSIDRDNAMAINRRITR